MNALVTPLVFRWTSVPDGNATPWSKLEQRPGPDGVTGHDTVAVGAAAKPGPQVYVRRA